MSVGPQIIPYGNVQATYILTASLTPTAVTTATTAEQSFTVPGILPGDQISGITFQGAWTINIDYVNYRVISANTIGISFQNQSGGTLTPPAGNYFVEINRPYPGLSMTAIQ